MYVSWLWIVVVALVFALLGLAWWWERGRWSRGSRARWRVAAAGEAEAVELLERAGYTVVEEQHTRLWSLRVDGEAVEVRSRADLLVERDGERFVAEVKTGDLAPNPRRPATRRQLLEYLFVFEVEGVLLVDMSARRVHEVRFGAGPDP